MAQGRGHRTDAAQISWALSPRGQAQVSPDLVTRSAGCRGRLGSRGPGGGVRSGRLATQPCPSPPSAAGRLQHRLRRPARAPCPLAPGSASTLCLFPPGRGVGQGPALHPIRLPESKPLPLVVPAEARPLTDPRGCLLHPEGSLVRGTGLSSARPESCAPLGRGTGSARQRCQGQTASNDRLPGDAALTDFGSSLRPLTRAWGRLALALCPQQVAPELCSLG